jgi:hypothetical protein
VNSADEKENEMITEIEQAITILDKSVIYILYTEYLLSYPPYISISPANDIDVEGSMCETILSSLDMFTPLTVPTPLMDEQFDDLSERALLGSSTSLLGHLSEIGDSCEL